MAALIYRACYYVLFGNRLGCREKLAPQLYHMITVIQYSEHNRQKKVSVIC